VLAAEITPFDWHRMFIGDIEWLYLLEIVFRTIVMYAYGFLLVRLIGKRAMRELTPFEYIIIIAMGSSMGDPMFMPDIPLLHCMVVLTVVLGLNRLFHSITSRTGHVEDRLKGFTDLIIKDGRIDIRTIKHEDFTLKELRSQLRIKGIKNLGEVRYAFVEPNGELSIFKYEDFNLKRIKGLDLLTEGIERDPENAYSNGSTITSEVKISCTECGNTISAKQGETAVECQFCGNSEWVESE
jgi:uncharacterized membrane protein YcaP (DUF421 family)